MGTPGTAPFRAIPANILPGFANGDAAVLIGLIAIGLLLAAFVALIVLLFHFRSLQRSVQELEEPLRDMKRNADSTSYTLGAIKENTAKQGAALLLLQQTLEGSAAKIAGVADALVNALAQQPRSVDMGLLSARSAAAQEAAPAADAYPAVPQQKRPRIDVITDIVNGIRDDQYRSSWTERLQNSLPEPWMYADLKTLDGAPFILQKGEASAPFIAVQLEDAVTALVFPSYSTKGTANAVVRLLFDADPAFSGGRYKVIRPAQASISAPNMFRIPAEMKGLIGNG